MMKSQQIVCDLVCAILWMRILERESYLHRESIDALSFSPTKEFERDARFSVETWDDEDRSLLETWLRAYEPNGLWTVVDSDYENWMYVTVLFGREEIEERLNSNDILNFGGIDSVLPVFLREAHEFHNLFRSRKDGQPALTKVEIHSDWFAFPTHFAEVLHTLMHAGYCEIRGSDMRWNPSIGPHMVSANLRVGKDTVDEINYQKLKQVWDSMPLRIKTSFLEKATPAKGLDVLALAMILGHFWYDGKWHTIPENEESANRGELKGGYISTAKEIDELYKAGKL
jgi:hypothetical protein